MSNKRQIQFDGEWVNSDDPTLAALNAIGYVACVYKDEKDGGYEYVLYRYAKNHRLVTVHTTRNREEFDNMVKLLLPPED